MTLERVRILLVDNDVSIEPVIQEKLRKKAGLDADIDFRQPKKRDIPFGCKMPVGEEFEKYDVALIDLEIFASLNDQTGYKPEDLRGGTEILPYIRREAPWLPVFAASQLFRKEAEDFLAIAGSFGFDGHIPLQMFNKGSFNRNLWDELIEAALLLRKKAVLGETVLSKARIPQIDASDDASNRLSKFSNWRELLQTTFCFASKVNILPLQSGFSGADIYRTVIRQHSDDGGSQGEWVWKVSNSPSKLHQEVQAHLAMLRAGLDHARMVPLLWQSVLVHSGVGAIAYKFAEGTKVASSMTNDIDQAIGLCKRIAPLFKRLYKKMPEEQSSVRNLLSNWSPQPEQLFKVANLLAGSDVERFLRVIAGERIEIEVLNSIVEYRQCLIHGDLHLGNIMLGEPNAQAPDVLIDFAKSGVGPIAVDMAKLVSDLLLRLSDSRERELPTWKTKSSMWQRMLAPLNKTINFSSGDEKLFNLFLIIFLAISLDYDDVPTDAKDWIKDVLIRQAI